MEVLKLSDDVLNQVKDFDVNYWNLTEKQKLLIDRLISNEKLKGRYKENGLCKECKQPKASYWCSFCTFQQDFKNWTSGSHAIDKFIQRIQLKARVTKGVIEWIEYDRFKGVEYLAKGGFGTVYKAIWEDGYISEIGNKQSNRTRDDRRAHPVALKCLHNSQDFTFLNEIESHIKAVCFPSANHVVRCYGITRDPETNKFMMVMEYAKNGSLRQFLNSNFDSFSWERKLWNLYSIANGLNKIHNNGLIHYDFHCGNILNSYDDATGSNYHYSVITDLGLSRPANEKSDKIYGVLPYVAPEVLRKKEYTQASDIYGFGIVAHELCTRFPPYHDIPHDEFLAAKICQGSRPSSNYKIPQIILDIINQCWDADPLKRPKADELSDLFHGLHSDVFNERKVEINKQIEEADKINGKLPPLLLTLKSSLSSFTGILSLSYTTHPQAIYTSRHLDFKDLPKPQNEKEYSDSVKIDFTNLNTEDAKAIFH